MVAPAVFVGMLAYWIFFYGFLYLNVKNRRFIYGHNVYCTKNAKRLTKSGFRYRQLGVASKYNYLEVVTSALQQH